MFVFRDVDEMVTDYFADCDKYFYLTLSFIYLDFIRSLSSLHKMDYISIFRLKGQEEISTPFRPHVDLNLKLWFAEILSCPGLGTILIQLTEELVWYYRLKSYPHTLDWIATLIYWTEELL
jgi:hypothetical protein